MFARRKFLMSSVGLTAALGACRLNGEAAHAQADASTRSPVLRPNAEQWDVTSKITGRTYRIYVAKPAWVEEAAPPEGYPVVYLTDGDFNFNTAAEAVMMQSIGLELKPAYVVGIGYGKDWKTASRTRCADLTPFPPADDTLAAMEASPLTKGATWGEAEGFHRFMTEELRPQIEATYPVNSSDAILWGHSFGGLFASYVLFNHPEAYQTYLINSPSLNLANGAILKDEAKLAESVAAGTVAPRVFLSVGEYEETLADYVMTVPGMTREQMQDLLKAFGMVTNALALSDRLKALEAPKGLDVEAVVFEAETHLSVLPATISRGLRFALKNAV